MQYWDLAGIAIPWAEPLDPLRLGPHTLKRVWWRHECAEGKVHHWYALVNNVVRANQARGRVPYPHCVLANRAAGFARRQGQLIKL